MTSESAGKTEPWIEKYEAEYAYAYDKGGKLSRDLGVSGLPTAVLVDAQGVIQWKGHPSSLSDDIVSKHLDGALPLPLWEWPKEGKKVKKAVLKDELGKALAEAAKLGDAHKDLHEVIQGMITSRLESLEQAKEEGDWMRVEDSGKALAKAFSGLPQKETVDKILADLKADKDAQAVIAGQRKVVKLFKKDKIKRKDIPKMQKQLEAIVDKYPSTAAARDAQAGIKRLQEMKKR